MAAGRNSQSLASIGKSVVIAGLILQLLWFILFVIVAGIFHRRMKRSPTALSQQPDIRWESYLHTLYFVSALIMIRSLFRVIEYIQGNSGYLLSNEAFLYIFDAVPMFLVVLWLHWRHPGEIGLLLRGQPASKNGFSLIRIRTRDAKY